jgi:hypothetical protein
MKVSSLTSLRRTLLKQNISCSVLLLLRSSNIELFSTVVSWLFLFFFFKNEMVLLDSFCYI